MKVQAVYSEGWVRIDIIKDGQQEVVATVDRDGHCFYQDNGHFEERKLCATLQEIAKSVRDLEELYHA